MSAGSADAFIGMNAYRYEMATIQLKDDIILISVKTERQREVRRHFAVPLPDVAEITCDLSLAGRSSAQDYWWMNDSRYVSDAYNAGNAVMIRLKRGAIRAFVLDIEDRAAVEQLTKGIG